TSFSGACIDESLMASVRKPDFFVIGAPRCGTTAMCQYLAEHPQIGFADPKEPFYFGTDFSWRITVTEEAYHHYFRNAGPEHAAVGEGSVYYLFSKTAVTEILAYQPNAKFVVMLRNPAEMVQSFHGQLLVAGQEDVPDFAEAWTLREARSQGENLPRNNRVPEFLQYRDWGMFGQQLRRLFGTVDRERVCVVIFDDFADNPKREYERILEFLNVPSDGRAEFPKVLGNQQIVAGKSHALVTWMLERAFDLRRMLGLHHPKFGILKRIRNLSERLSFRKGKRAELSPDLAEELRVTFREDIELLSEILDRDLRHWSDPTE
ncbi:MAG: sulfotransferase, partial [Verrucomicrobiota bacterium]